MLNLANNFCTVLHNLAFVLQTRLNCFPFGLIKFKRNNFYAFFLVDKNVIRNCMGKYFTLWMRNMKGRKKSLNLIQALNVTEQI